MKKTLPFILLLFSCVSFSQNFWESKATGFSETNRGLNSISIVSDDVIWASAYDGASTSPLNVRQYSKSTDGGNTWQSGNINLGANQSLLNVSSISATSENVVYVSAYSTNNTTVKGGIWKTIDQGISWTKISGEAFGFVNDSFCNFVHFFDENNGVAQGDPAGGNFEIYVTTDAGTTWSRVQNTNLPAPLSGEYGYAMKETYGDIIWFPTNKGRIYKSTNKGVSWTVTQSPASDFGSNNSFARFTFKDANNGLLIKNNLEFYKTTNGGTTWTTLTATGKKGARDICYIPNTDTVISVGTENGISFTSYSLNNGNTWTETMSGTQVVGLYFKNSTIGFGGGFSTSYSNGGVFKYNSEVLSNAFFEKELSNKIYPNPANNLVHFKIENLQNVTIIDMQGKIILSTSNATINIESVTSGIYIAKITDATGNLFSEKLIIE